MTNGDFEEDEYLEEKSEETEEPVVADEFMDSMMDLFPPSPEFRDEFFRWACTIILDSFSPSLLKLIASLDATNSCIYNLAVFTSMTGDPEQILTNYPAKEDMGWGWDDQGISEMFFNRTLTKFEYNDPEIAYILKLLQERFDIRIHRSLKGYERELQPRHISHMESKPSSQETPAKRTGGFFRPLGRR